MPTWDPSKKFLEQKQKLAKRIFALCASIDQDLAVAFAKYFEENSYAYFSFEEKLNAIKTLFESIQDQIVASKTIPDLSKMAARVGFVEDRMDELIAPLYNRRRRKRNSFRFSDFFNKYKEQIGSGAESEISSLQTAFELLGLSGNENMIEVTTAFRSLAKKYHPDTLGGDRSGEIELRRIVGAYQYIKQNHRDQ
jgi:hypothetical protein